MQDHSKEPATPADWSAWATVPWTPLTGPATGTDGAANSNPIIGYHKASVPCAPRSNPPLALQTLDVWLPASASPTTPDASTLPQPSSAAAGPGTWIIYIHGGAWRDPAITASSFTPAATALLQSQLTNTNKTSTTSPDPRLAGLASLNYRLSPHPAHPAPADPARQARHPDHIADIRAALAFLHRLLPASAHEHSYILAGHSCGATLAFQAVMAPSRWGLSPTDPRSEPPAVAAVVGFNGLYDLAGFLAAPPAGYAHLAGPYAEFTRGAFGGDERVWRAEDKKKKRTRKVLAVLVQSREDTLVPYAQLEGLRGVLEREGGGAVEVRVMEAGGDHDDIWKDGRRMAEVLAEVVAGGLA
ncbi:alpha/beta-hydrolase [Trichocladium antarcticum]|uniref:Kynurenine formamidase n=1 Tax=Trichocladium antarcticum TaxID=1450529 RepID=A0AAN6ZF70_9PEZI|nr:alpha/beta-hydrolase [Trichocladium antarcticum]